ncbi:hypothetical protein ABT294_24410 [Nonomuraea sp. NPDC000554]|uniref:hypothetical protein n=1 Tax=Nonomuraea sp. NPDC000554 TaxID=3154259 RepID=UPI0033211B94
MNETRCERCDLPIGLGCSCAGPPVTAFVPFEILISPNQCAHLPEGCNHTAGRERMESAWGWIPRPRPGLWTSIGPDNPVRAQAGNRDRIADRRCGDCDHTFPDAN